VTTVQKLSPKSQAAWDKFRERVSEMGGEVVEPVWRGATVKHQVRCPEGHAGHAIPHLLPRRLRLCPVCPLPVSLAAWEKFQKRVGELGGEVLDAEWRGNRQKYSVKCSEGHVSQIWPIGLFEGRDICTWCTGMSPDFAWETFKALVEQLGGVVLEEAWKGRDERHACLCPEGHQCAPRPVYLRRGGGLCRVCAGSDPRVAEAAFHARVMELGGEVLEPKWLGSGKPHRIRCREGHECTPTPSSIQKGNGICRVCTGHKWDVFYVVLDDINAAIKFGITSGDPRPRLGVHARDGFDEVVRLVEGLPDDLAPRLERAVRAALRDARETPVRGREYFPARVMGLVLDVVDGWTTASVSAGEPEQLALDIAA
jgi:hypothetical protein